MIFLSFLSPFISLSIIIFIIVAIMEGKEQKDKRQVIRSVYFYLASLVTLAIVVGSTIFLINLGFKSWVFTEAEPTAYRAGMPPSVSVAERVAPVEEPAPFLACEDTCVLTSEQSDTIETWKTNYATWRENNESNSDRARDAVNAFSFLIIALPFFLIHFRIVQKDAKKEAEKERAVIRPTYYYFVSLASLLMIVIAGGMLINLTLKTWVFPSAGEADKIADPYDRVEPYQLSEKSAVYSIIDCGERCDVDDETIVIANQWIEDYDAWDNASLHAYNNTQRQAASAIPFIIAGIPLFWYHWSTIRKESKDKKES